MTGIFHLQKIFQDIYNNILKSHAYDWYLTMLF